MENSETGESSTLPIPTIWNPLIPHPHTSISPTTHTEFPLNPLDNRRPLGIQLIRIPLMTLLLAVLEPTTPMILQHAMFATEMALTEAAIAHDALRRVLAVLEVASYLLGRHAAAHGEGEVQGGFARDRER